MLRIRSKTTPDFIDEQLEHFIETVKNYTVWYIADEKFDYNHNSLLYWQIKAEMLYKENTQDCHSKDFKQWLEDRAVYYNNGFYEFEQRNYCKTKSLEFVKTCISKKYYELFSVHQHEYHEYGFSDLQATAVKFGNKYIMFGTSSDTCGSDWIDSYLFWVFNTEEEMMKAIQHKNFVCKQIEKQHNASEMFEFISNHKLENAFVSVMKN